MNSKIKFSLLFIINFSNFEYINDKKNYKFASNEKYVFLYIYEYKGSNNTQNIA